MVLSNPILLQVLTCITSIQSQYTELLRVGFVKPRRLIFAEEAILMAMKLEDNLGPLLHDAQALNLEHSEDLHRFWFEAC